MASRPTGRALDEVLGSPPPGATLVLVISAFLCGVYLLLGAFELGASRVAVSAGWVVFGGAHLLVAYGLGRGTRWGWKLGVVVYGLAVLVFASPYAGPTDVRIAGLFGVIVLYLVTRRDSLDESRTDEGGQ